jgi:hypothetical protein
VPTWRGIGQFGDAVHRGPEHGKLGRIGAAEIAELDTVRTEIRSHVETHSVTEFGHMSRSPSFLRYRGTSRSVTGVTDFQRKGASGPEMSQPARRDGMVS